MRPDRYILNAAGEPEPCDDLSVWAAAMERGHATRSWVVAKDCDEGADSVEVEISTVFLGLDYGWGDGPPVLWETLVFGGPLDGEMDRYISRAHALCGHQAMCRRVAQALRA